MYFKQLLLLAVLALGVLSDDSGSVEVVELSSSEANFLGALIALGYEENKQDFIVTMTETLSENMKNISVIGWQNVLGEDGQIEEVRTVSLHFPTLGSSDEESDTEDSNDAWNDFGEVLGLFNTLSDMGLPMEASQIDCDDEGVLKELVYIDADTQYVFTNGLGYLNQTKTVQNEDEIKKVIKSHEHEIVPVAVIKYDADGDFIEEDSKLVPELYVTIIDDENSTEEILQAITEGLGKFGIKYLNESEKIPKALALYLKEKLPKYIFHVTTNVNGYYINKDVYVEAKFELTSYETGDLYFYIFAVEK